MQVFEKIIEKFSNIHRVVKNDEDLEWNRAVYKCTEIVKKEAAEHNNGWIPCNSGKLPKENEYVRVTIWCGHEWVGCYRDGKWFVYGSAGLAEATVLAWQPTEPYQPKGE